MEGEWFRWVIGIMVTLQTGVIGAIAAICWNQQKVVGVMDKRLSLLEEREHVNPISYTKVMTEFSMTITALTRQTAEHITNFERRMGELSADVKQLQRQLEGRSR